MVSVTPDRANELLALAKREGVPAAAIGRVGGDRIRVSIDGRGVIDEPVADAERIWAAAIERYFEPEQAMA